MVAKKLFANALDISNEEYHSDISRISKSGLDAINKSPAHYFAKYLDPNREPRKETEAFKIGSATHSAILEPHLFEKIYTIVPDIAPKRPTSIQLNAKNPSKDTIISIDYYKKFDEENKDCLILKADEFYSCCRMRDAVHSHPAARELLADGFAEQTFHFTEPETGVNCKIRPDFISHLRFVTDVKTTDDASPNKFGVSAKKYRYGVQSPYYLDGVNFATGEQMEGFVFIAVEKEPPFAVACYIVKDEDIRIGREQYLENLTTYQACNAENIWPSYSDVITELQIPNYNK